MRTSLKILAVACVVTACAAPKRDYDAEQIRNITEFEELMWVQATVADPRFALLKKLDPNTMTKEQFAEFEDMGRRLQLTAARIPDFSKGKSFDRFAQELQGHAKDLEAAAKAGNGPATAKQAINVKTNCKACHDRYR